MMTQASGVDLADLGQGLHAAHAGHGEIEDDHGRAARDDSLGGVRPVGRAHHAHALRGEDVLEERAHLRLVVHDEQGGSRARPAWP